MPEKSPGDSARMERLEELRLRANHASSDNSGMPELATLHATFDNTPAHKPFMALLF